MKFIAGIIGGLIVATIGVIVLGVTLTPYLGKNSNVGVIAFFMLWGVSLVVALMARSAGKAWRRLLITSGILSILLPLSALIFTGTEVAGAVKTANVDGGIATTGTLIAGGLFSGVMGFVGFFLAAFFLVIGFVVGREKEVMYVIAGSE